MTLVELTLAIHAHLGEAEVAHAFGGALALAYYAEPRATADIDVNVFVAAGDISRVLEALAPLGLRALDGDASAPVGGVRLVPTSGLPKVDLFPGLDERYVGVRDRVRQHPFGPDRRVLPFLGPDDLVVFKLSFGRPRDWLDIEEIVASGTELDLELIDAQLLALRGPHMHPRLARLRSLVAARRQRDT